MTMTSKPQASHSHPFFFLFSPPPPPPCCPIGCVGRKESGQRALQPATIADPTNRWTERRGTCASYMRDEEEGAAVQAAAAAAALLFVLLDTFKNIRNSHPPTHLPPPSHASLPIPAHPAPAHVHPSPAFPLTAWIWVCARFWIFDWSRLMHRVSGLGIGRGMSLGTSPTAVQPGQRGEQRSKTKGNEAREGDRREAW